MEDKVVISLISVAAGWLLAQCTTLIRDWWSAKKLRNGLLTELEDIDEQLRRVILIHSRQLQIFALNGIEPTASLPVQNLFFKQYFKDAFSHLERQQRISYQLIHGSLDVLNKRNEELAAFADRLFDEHMTKPEERGLPPVHKAWGDRVTVLFKMAKNLRWHIAYHLDNPAYPELDYQGEVHKSYLKFQHKIDQEIKDIIENAKKLNRDDFEKYYKERTVYEERASSGERHT